MTRSTRRSPTAPGDARRDGAPPHGPVWRIPAMWLVIGLPATAVVASIASAVIAVHGADRVVTQPATAADEADNGAAARSNAPAEHARNHVNVPNH
jgi:hypothetical protein